MTDQGQKFREELAFKEKLFKHVNFEVDIVLNENRSTMLNVLSRKKDFAKLSMHKMFLQAPDDVISAIAQYVRGRRRERKEDSLKIRSFIQSRLEKLDYSSHLSLTRLEPSGHVYDLGKIYQELNQTYFSNQLNLSITWYGKRGRRNRSRIIFGQYFDHLRLIKINRILDDVFFPDFFVKFVVYHEMLHHIVPGHIDKRGFFCTHGAMFKAKEKEFALYEKAISWEKMNKEQFFI